MLHLMAFIKLYPKLCSFIKVILKTINEPFLRKEEIQIEIDVCFNCNFNNNLYHC